MEDLRKLTLEHNLHSFFRLVNDEELRKIILEDNVWSLWRWLDHELDSELVRALKRVQVRELDFDTSSLSRGQIQSKLWLVKTLKELNCDLGVVFLCAGWYGLLATLLFEADVPMDRVRSFDLDLQSVEVAEAVNLVWLQDNWRFKAFHHDILQINYHQFEWQFWSKKNNRMSYPPHRYSTNYHQYKLRAHC
jgi:hypothetical protein